jgi:hypothetical protein
MSFLEFADKTMINRVLIQSRLSDPPSAQRRVAGLLATARWDTHLPPSAVLRIRRLYDPLPGADWLDRNRVVPSQQWEQALGRNLDHLASEAARPVSNPVPPSAEAVLFLDKAEMFTCLARDWLGGTLRTNWRWSIFRLQDPMVHLPGVTSGCARGRARRNAEKTEAPAEASSNHVGAAAPPGPVVA